MKPSIEIDDKVKVTYGKFAGCEGVVKHVKEILADEGLFEVTVVIHNEWRGCEHIMPYLWRGREGDAICKA